MLKRGMEEAMMDALAKRVRVDGGEKLIGYYYPTAKNGMVRDFYYCHGFSLLEDTEGSTVWSYDLTKKDATLVQKHFISVKKAAVER